MLCMLPTLLFSFQQRNASALFDTCQLLSLVPLNFVKRTVRPRAKGDINFVETHIACGSQSDTETQDCFICTCCS